MFSFGNVCYYGRKQEIRKVLIVKVEKKKEIEKYELN